MNRQKPLLYQPYGLWLQSITQLLSLVSLLYRGESPPLLGAFLKFQGFDGTKSLLLPLQPVMLHVVLGTPVGR